MLKSIQLEKKIDVLERPQFRELQSMIEMLNELLNCSALGLACHGTCVLLMETLLPSWLPKTLQSTISCQQLH